MITTIDWLAVVVVCAALLIVLGLVALILRRRLIARGDPLAMVALREGESWRLGMTKLTSDRVLWFAIIGFGVRPRREWRRGDLVLGPPAPLGRAKPVAIVDPIQVECTVGDDDRFVIAIAPGDYTALRSWSESAPPGLNSNVA